MRFLKALLIAFIALSISGCAHSAKSVGFKFVEPSGGLTGNVDADKYQIKAGQTVFIDAKPIEPLAAPGYPKAHQKPDADPVTLVVRFIVGTDGHVEAIERSLSDFSVPTLFVRECFDAVKDAVARWRFEPAQLAIVEPQANGRPLIVSSTPTERPFEIAVTFSASGRVVPEFTKRKK